MKLVDSLVLLGVAALPLAAPLADGAAPKPRLPLVILGRDVMAAQDAARKQGAALADAIRQLGDPDAKVRHDAYETLKQEGETARAALEEASKSDDAERRFAATQLLDRLDHEKQARAHARSSTDGLLCSARAIDSFTAL